MNYDLSDSETTGDRAGGFHGFAVKNNTFGEHLCTCHSVSVRMEQISQSGVSG